jgi:glyoxylase-like metal-dependent hydrolase (beta-lactamase superfamily II)
MPPVVDRYELGPFQANCYVVRAERGLSDAVLVDPGDDATTLRLELARMSVRCSAILLTHSHVDHIGAVADLADGRGVQVYMPEAEADVLRSPDVYFSSYGISARPYEPDVLLRGGETLELAGMMFEVVSVPGHSPGHVAFYTDGALFSGDVLFAGSVGRTDLPGGSWDVLLDSIRTLLDRYPPETIVYSGHGPATTLAAELARNPFLADLRAERAARDE